MAFTHLGQQQYEITHGIQSALWYTQISPPATPSKDRASTPVVQEKKRGIRHHWCEGEGSVMNNGISQCSVLSYIGGPLPLTPCTVYIGLQQQRHAMHARGGSGESTDKHDFVNTVIIYLQKHFKNATSLVTLTEQFKPVLFTNCKLVHITGPTVLHAVCSLNEG